jgi:hypothetical protein
MKQLELLFATLFSCKAATLETLLAGSSGILGLCRDYITLVNSKQNSGFTLQSRFPISERES